jgi:hypothetical protein
MREKIFKHDRVMTKERKKKLDWFINLANMDLSKASFADKVKLTEESLDMMDDIENIIDRKKFMKKADQFIVNGVLEKVQKHVRGVLGGIWKVELAQRAALKFHELLDSIDDEDLSQYHYQNGKVVKKK